MNIKKKCKIKLLKPLKPFKTLILLRPFKLLTVNCQPSTNLQRVDIEVDAEGVGDELEEDLAGDVVEEGACAADAVGGSHLQDDLADMLRLHAAVSCSGGT